MNGEQRPRWYFAHSKDDLNLRILRMFEGTFSLDAALGGRSVFLNFVQYTYAASGERITYATLANYRWDCAHSVARTYTIRSRIRSVGIGRNFSQRTRCHDYSLLLRVLGDLHQKANRDYTKIQYITKTRLYNFDPLKPHFYNSKTRVYRGIHYFSYFARKDIECGCSLEPPHQGGSNEYPQYMFWAEIWKYLNFLSEKFSFLVVKFSIYLNRRVFVRAWHLINEEAWVWKK